MTRGALHAFWLRLRNWWVEPRYAVTSFSTESQNPFPPGPTRNWRSRDNAVVWLMGSLDLYPFAGPWWLVRKEA